MHRTQRPGLTLVEMLVVIFVVGVLVALLLPAVQASRESARRNSCQNHLKQFGLGMLSHESVYRRFPTGGWGFAWVGDPDRGTGKNQPGGWAFSLLPYIEQTALAQIGKGQSFNAKSASLTEVVTTPLAILNCPTRRSMAEAALAPNPPPINYNLVPMVAKGDYAVNAGDYVVTGGPGPPSLADGDNPTYPWDDTSLVTGIGYLRSEVVLAKVLDGTSVTYLIGEKYKLNSAGVDLGDDQSMYSGYDYDTCRWGQPKSPPLPDAGVSAPDRFGSAHPTVCNFVFCDGSLHAISFDIDQEVHRRLSNRQDGLAVAAKDL